MSNSRNIDGESRDIIRTKLDANLLIEAGAGSGKTQMLAERMAAGVAAGAYPIEEMAAVTFTRKAASELRGRFHLALEERLASARSAAGAASRRAAPEGCHDAASVERLEYALGNLERLFAGTIHSFCARLLRERPIESGVSPGFTELDEVEDVELRERCWRDFVTAARAAGHPVMVELLEAGVRPADLDHAFGIVYANEDVDFPPGDGECPDSKPALKALERFWKELQKHLPASIDPDTTCNIQKAALQFRGQFRVSRNRLDRASTIASLFDTWDCESKITQNRWGTTAAEKRRFKELICGLHAEFREETVAPYLAAWRQYVYRLSVSLLAEARKHAADERRRVNVLNYSDLLILTARVLRENTAVRHALQQKYRFLFVDEFQDTDPIQAEIVFLLAAQEPAVLAQETTAVRRHFRSAAAAQPFRVAMPTAADWRTIPLRPGALFVVGDPKQSIYRFRRADIEIYNVVRSRLGDPEVGRVVPLTMNFRSAPDLCTWANDVFETRFPAEPTLQSPKFAPLDPRQGYKGPKGGVFTLTHACDKDEVRDEDAGQIARYIRAEVDAGRRRFSDFLILTRKKKERLAPYAAALEELTVPIEVSGAGAFGESAEVEALTVLLRSLADPQDALTLVAVLRGPIFGISDPELFAFKRAGGWFSIFFDSASVRRDSGPGERSARDFSPAASRVVDALAALRLYHRWTRLLPAGAALDRMLEHTGYLALAATTPGGVEAGDLLHAIDRVRRVVEDGGSLADAADALEADAEASNEVESLPLEPGRTDVVRLMNLHKAKGLEAKVVFLADPCGGPKPRVEVHIARRGMTPQGWFKVEKKSENSWASKLLGEHADWETHEQTELPFLQAEEDRLLYVAATRAREILVISRWTGNQHTPAWGALNGFLSKAKELRIPPAVSVKAPSVADCSTTSQADAVAAMSAAHDRARQASWSITSVTAEAHHVAKMATAPQTSADDATKVVLPTTESHRADAGMAWGTLIHGLLEHAMRHKDATREDLHRLAMWLTVEEPELREAIDRAIDTVQRVAGSAFWTDAQRTTHWEETPFTFGRANVLTTGVIDLIHGTPEGWHITDYKTDADGGAGKSAVYAAQVSGYREALEACGVKVEGVAIAPVRAK
jgi:ATP-dependent helicase/nuclease subunit A